MQREAGANAVAKVFSRGANPERAVRVRLGPRSFLAPHPGCPAAGLRTERRTAPRDGESEGKEYRNERRGTHEGR